MIREINKEVKLGLDNHKATIMRKCLNEYTPR